MFDKILSFCYDYFVVKKEKLMKPTSEMYTTLTVTEKAEIKTYGMTIKALCDAVETSMIYEGCNPEQIVRTMIVNVMHMVGNDPDDMFDAQKDIKRAIFVLQNYCTNQYVAIKLLTEDADIAFIDGDVEALIDVLRQAKNAMVNTEIEVG